LEDAEKLRNSLRRLMWGKVGIVRARESLTAAVAQLLRWARAVDRDFCSRADLEVKNMVQVARCMAEAALWRENSVGAHYRADFPTLERGWKEHSEVRRGADVGTGSPQLKATTKKRQAKETGAA
jgi:L-aspartate oxidase